MEIKTETGSGSDLAAKLVGKIDFPRENTESTLAAKTTPAAATTDSLDWTRSSGIEVSDDDSEAAERVSPKLRFDEKVVGENSTKNVDETRTTLSDSTKIVPRKSSSQGFRYKMQELMRKMEKERQRINQMIPTADPIETSKFHFLVIQKKISESRCVEVERARLFQAQAELEL